MPDAFDFLTMMALPYRNHTRLATIEMRCFKPKRLGGGPGPRDWFPAGDDNGIVDAVDFAVQYAQNWDVYFGVLPRREGLGDYTGIRLAAYLWADIDGAGSDLETVGEFVLDTLDSSLPHPTLMVCSGGGYHVYWQLSEPVPVKTREEQDAFHKVLARLYRKFNGPALDGTWNRDGWKEKAALGLPYACPKVKDVSRVLRVPGTLNHKEETPRPVECVWFHPEVQTYPLVWWRANLPALPEPPRREPMKKEEGWNTDKKVEYFRRLASEPVPDGERHNAMLRFACFAFDRGLDESYVEEFTRIKGEISGAECVRNPGHVENIVRWARDHRQNAR